MTPQVPYWVTRVVNKEEDTVKLIEHFPGADVIEFPEMPRAMSTMLLRERQRKLANMNLETYLKALAEAGQYVKHEHDPSKPCNCGAKK